MFFYSFTQIDLGLTISQASVWQTAEKLFKNIGYFQRPLSSYLFVGLILSLFFFYLMILYRVHKKEISKKTIWFLTISTVFLLTFSYNAFSYDLFNYIFDAKIVTYYHQNPYLHKALDFPGDPMLSFMHWTHRLYPYGPFWLGLTVPLSFIGLQYFLPTFFLFKILMSLSFLGTVFFIGKILQKVSSDDEIFGITFFALNPLVVIESLVSSHNDIVLVFFAMWAVYLLMSKKYARSTMLLGLSVGVKFTSLFILPIFLLVYFLNKKKKTINWQNLFSAMALLMTIPVVLAAFRTNFQPWYLLNLLPFLGLVSRKYYFFIPGMILSLFSIFQYLPFLYLGNWDKPVPSILLWITISSILSSIILIAMFFVRLAVHKRRIK
ncbi:MAG: glycosyltransferase family 87 protein [bacterium]|nr:glycosyltransferase family 87 protein [bacterium]